MSVNYKLKARIVEMYRTQSRFAVACGRGDNWLSRIIQKQQLPTMQEKKQFMLKLKISPEDIENYFSAE